MLNFSDYVYLLYILIFGFRDIRLYKINNNKNYYYLILSYLKIMI